MEEVYPPLMFNLWKHHAEYIVGRIRNHSSGLEALSAEIVIIGDSVTDLYFGELMPEAIYNEIRNNLGQHFFYTKMFFLHWLYDQDNDYKIITLSDKSVWTIREGDSEDRFIHIHPGRSSPLTERLRASTLKTVILVLADIYMNGFKVSSDERINEIREKYLSLPPLKSVDGSEKLKYFLNRFRTIL